jgi:zinc protease
MATLRKKGSTSQGRTARKAGTTRKAGTERKQSAPRKEATKSRGSTRKAAGRKAAEQGTGALKLPQVVESTTSSGLRVLAAERGPLPLVNFRLVIRAGSALDPTGKFGLADFTSRLLRRGTATLSAQEIDEAVEFVGASLGVSTGEDVIHISVTTPAEHFADMLRVVAKLVREPSFPESEVALARERVLAQLANDLDDPSEVADRAFLRATWGEHPYGHEVAGRIAHVRTFTREDVVRFHREHLGPRVSQLTVVGTVSPEVVAAEAERAFGNWEGGPAEPPQMPAFERMPHAGRVVLVDKPDQTQAQVRMAGIGFRIGHPDYFPATAMNIALGGGFTSRLMTEVRVNRGLTYGISSYFDSGAAGGIYAISTFTKTESTREIIDASLGEVVKVREQGIPAAELRRAQTYMAGLYPLRTETNESVGAQISDIRLYGLGEDWVEEFRDRLKAVTPKQVKEVAEKYCYPTPPLLVVLGRAEEIRPQLEGLRPVEVVPYSEYE